MYMNAILNILYGLVKSVKIAFLTVFGKIKIYRWPMFIIYDPKGYDIKAKDIRLAMSMAKKGDIFVRRYRNYLDGYFIPGRFSHSSIYMGDGVIIHSMSGGVQKIDIIDFLRCDGFAILRPKSWISEETIDKACEFAKSHLGSDYDFDFEDSDGDEKFYCHELVRKCYSKLDIPKEIPSLWNGMIKSKKQVYLAQSFFDSPDIEVVYDSDFSTVK